MMANSGEVAAADRIDLAETADFDLGAMRFSPARREARLNGECRELEPRVAQVLVALASVRPNVVSRDRLIDQCWDGRTVGDDALNRCIVALRHLARNFSPEPFAIRTIPRVGYSLVECVHDGIPVTDNALESAGVGRGSRALRIWTMFAVGAAAAALILAIVLWRSGAQEEGPASIAVLPFRNLSGGEPYFAEGVSEEILGHLSREPQFRVAGSGSTRQFGKDPDIDDIASRLDVEYVLQGSVRRQADRVRVSANLVRTSDGTQLWSDSYDGTLDDIFAIQTRIGSSIAGALKRRLVKSPSLSGPLVTNGEAYNLYLTARGLIRTNSRWLGQPSADLLREALKMDPNYAPAWASLAHAVRIDGSVGDNERLIAKIGEAERYARHALRLAPDLAEAHAVLGLVLGLATPEAQAHIRRAAELDSSNAATLLWLGTAHENAGEFGKQLASFRRAAEIDPLWYRTVTRNAAALVERGDQDGAERVARRGFANNPVQLTLLLGSIAATAGDFSEGARGWSVVARSNSPRWSRLAEANKRNVLFLVGLGGKPPVYSISPPPDTWLAPMRFWIDGPPTPAAWRAHNRSRIAEEVYHRENQIAAKLMLAAGRAPELATTYAGPLGLLGYRAGARLRVDQVDDAPLVALALRQVGRAVAADRLLREADERVRAAIRSGPAPFRFDASAAAVWAVQGRREEAMAMLEQAFQRGWRHADATDLPDINDEPALRSLHGNPRFEALRAKLAAHYQREKRELTQLAL